MKLRTQIHPFWTCRRQASEESYVRRRKLNIALVLVICLIALEGLGGLSAATVPAGFTETVIPGPSGGSWNGAVGLTFDATGRMFVWERTGRLWFKDPSDVSFSLLLDISEEVCAGGDYGFLGFALDPEFRVNGYIYLLYGVDRHYLLNFGTPNYNPNSNEYDAATIGRVTRYTCRSSDGFRSVDLASRFILIGETKQTGFPICSNSHGIGSLVFGEDGTLLVSCGDGASAWAADIGGAQTLSYAPQALADGIIRPKEDIGAFRSQLVDCLNGKVVRIDPTTGNGLPSNPYYDAANPRSARSRVWTLGLRNPFRMSLRPESGSHNPADGNPGVLYIGDVGWNTLEMLRVVTGPGQNGGWPTYEGFNLTPSYSGQTYDVDVANLDAPNPLYPTNGCRQYFSFRDLLKEDTLDPLGQPPFVNPCNSSQRIPNSVPQFLHTRPVLDWNHGSAITRTPIYSTLGQAQTANAGAGGSPVSGTQFQGNCAVGGAWYTGTNFPSQYQNMYFFADWGQRVMKTLTCDQNNKPLNVAGFASNGGAIVCVVQHPTDGSLYYVSYENGTALVWQLAYTGNRTPIAVASANLYYGPGPLTVQFSSSGSSDPDGQPITYSWNFGDGTPVTNSANPSHTFTAPVGVPTKFVVTLTVTDSGGLPAQASLIVAANDTPPNVTITSPVDGALYSPSNSTTVNLTATVSDAESNDGQLLYQWQVLLHHNDHNHVFATASNHVTTTVISPTGCDGINIYYYRILLTVTDPHGLSTTREVRLFPDCGPNTPPTISSIADQSIIWNTSTAPLSFTIGDAETAAANLQLSGSSSNPTLVPDGNIVFGGSGANRKVTVTPSAGQTGTATITVTVTDGPLSTSETFELTAATDTTAPTIPSGVNAAAVNGSRISVSWVASTDNVGVTGYLIERSQGAGSTAFAQVGAVSGTNYDDTGLSAGAVCNYRVRATDAATNLSGYSSVSSAATPAPDTTAPMIPAQVSAVATSTMEISLSWAASTDNVGVTGYLIERSQGAGSTAFAPVGTVSGTNYGDTGLSAGTVYNYRVRATDAATNLSGYSSTGSATTLPRTTGLVAAYAFGEGSGSAVVDASGHGNSGTISGATWTTGKFGQALSFNGTGARVTVNDAALLHLTNAMTLEAWVYPTAVGGWKEVICKEANAIYYLMGSSANADRPAVGGAFATDAAFGTTSLPLNTWSHLAGIYDGTTIQLFVNGLLVANRPQTGAIPTSTGMLTMGGDTVYGQYWAGRIDEVRIYSRALSPAEIQNDMNTIITNTAPTISSIPDQSTMQNTATASVPFTINDGDTSVSNLTLSASSSNPNLVPTNNIVFGGSGTNRTVTVTPATNQLGMATITVKVSDGVNTASDTFVLTVIAPPTQVRVETAADGSGIVVPAKNVNPNGFGSITLFAIARDVFGNFVANVAADSWLLTNVTGGVAGSDLVASGNMKSATFTGHAAGSARIHVTSGALTAVDAGTFTVLASTPPTMAPIPNRATLIGRAAGPFPITVYDPDTPVGSLVLSGTSSDTNLVTNGDIIFYNDGLATQTLTVTPAVGQTGTATITISVSDGVSSTNTSFLLTVNPAGAGTAIIDNLNAITILDNTVASLYPSTISVTGMVGAISQVTLTLKGVSHTYPGDIDVLLVGPGGQKVMVFSDVGGALPISNVTVTLSDSAESALPTQSQIISGTYKPTDFETGDPMPAPAPVGPYGTNLGLFNGLSPNGTWSLYVVDDGPGDAGAINGGWSLAITTQSPQPIMNPPTLTSPNATLSWSAVAGTSYRVQYKPDLSVTNWSDLAGDVTAIGTNAIKVDTTVGGAINRFYRVQVLP